MGSNTYRDLLSRRKDRIIAVILGFKDAEVDEYLPMDVSRGLRSAILDGINEYHDLVMDILKSMENESLVINEDFISRLEDLHERVMDTKVT